MVMTKYAFKNLVKQCLAEVIVESPTGPWTVRYAVLGLEGIPTSTHPTKGEAMQAAKEFIQSYNTAKSRNAGEYIEGIENGYALKHIGGGTRAIAVAVAPSKKNPYMEASQPEPYDDKTDTFAPGPRDRTEPVQQPAKPTKPPVEIMPTGRTDDWSRPIYVDAKGRYFVDINLGKGTPDIHYTTDPEGEPEFRVKNVKIVQKLTEVGELRADKLSNSERRKIHDAFKKAGLDGNGRFEKKEHGLAAVTQALSTLGFQLDMVSGDMIMGDKGMRNFVFRRANDPGQDAFTEKPEITNSRIVFNWERMDGPTHQYPNSPHVFEILVYAS